jgi:hypothetical protein
MSIKSVGTVDVAFEGAAWEPALLDAVRGVRFGSVEVVIHDGRVTQIERREKVRFDAEGRLPDNRRREDNQERRADRATGGGGLEKKQ